MTAKTQPMIAQARSRLIASLPGLSPAKAARVRAQIVASLPTVSGEGVELNEWDRFMIRRGAKRVKARVIRQRKVRR